MNKGICKLCLQEKELINRSHIFSEFLYREAGLLGDNPPLIIEVQKLRDGSYKDEVPKLSKTGEFERGILCADCDNNIIGAYESYGSQIMFHNDNYNKFISQGGVKYAVYIDVNYTKCKLFILSLLWRASISSRSAFNNAKLSVENEEELRLMILNGDANEPDKYPFLIYSHRNIDESELPTDLFIPPLQSTNRFGYRSYRFYIGGNFFDVFLNSISEGFSEFILKPEGKLTIFHLEKYQADRMLKEIIVGVDEN